MILVQGDRKSLMELSTISAKSLEILECLSKTLFRQVFSSNVTCTLKKKEINLSNEKA